MFEEQDDMFNSLTRPYKIPRFPTKTNIKTPILLIYGGVDSLVDINVMRNNLPLTNVFDIKVDLHEHLDLIWGKDTDTLVIAKVLRFIEFFSGEKLLQSTTLSLGEPERLMPVKTPISQHTSRRNSNSSVGTENATPSTFNVRKTTTPSNYRYEQTESPTAQYGLEKLNSLYSNVGRELEDIDEKEAFLDYNTGDKMDEIQKTNSINQRRLSEYLDSSTDLKQMDSNATTTVNTPN